ncbi:hypothetical protein [Pontiella sulfatireligans]|uniref:Amylopullulanase n=1 Tax=Pontiella sulfatireligans TaxID=2750658 RepID=A0A6C2UKQ8_9BACT|nr:hypothetical protein [Pontiella sulfatireligans]VGO20473.1 Amylopullulanase [Pontiella sulfatireligans]
MKIKTMIAVLLSMGALSAWAAFPINTSFSSSDSPAYSDADLAGQNGWTQIAAYSNAFNVVDSAGSGFITTLNNGYTGGELPVSMQVDSANAVDTEWDGYIDFKLSRTTSAWDSGAVLELGLSVANTFLNPGNVSTGDEWDLRIISENVGNSDRIQLSVQKSPGWAVIASLTPAEAGWDGTGGSDLETQNLRAVFNVRKTREGVAYALTGELINLDASTTNGGSTALQTVSNAYNAASLDYFVIQHDAGADVGETSDRFDATIDALSIDVTENVPPVLATPTLNAFAGDGTVDLSWDTVFEAGTYDLTWSSTSGGTYSPVTGGSGLTTNAFTDTGLSNGTEYWYKVTAKASGAADAVSVPVDVTPEAPPTAVGNTTILDTSFTSAEGYISADLAGQKSWNAIADSNPKAFLVDPAGAGFAESDQLFATNGGNDVVYSLFTSNEVGSVWSGTTVFSVSAVADGATVTNVVGGVTNIGTVANLSGAEEFFEFGISSDTANTDLFPEQDDDVLWVVRNDASDGIAFGLNMHSYNVNKALLLTKDQVGWDPLWETVTSNSLPDLVTDEITLDWYIRKSTVTSKYNGQVIATVGGLSHTSLVVYTESNPAVDAYVAELVEFGMGHRIPAGQELYVSVDSISVVHTNASEIPHVAPFDITGQQGNLAITLSWLAGGEQDSFSVYRSEVYGVEGALIASGLTASTYVDSDSLVDKRSYIYTIKSVYGATEVASDQFAVFALAVQAPLHYPGEDLDWAAANETAGGDTYTAVAGNGFTTYVTGDGPTDPASTSGAKSVFTGADFINVDTNICPLIFMVSQGDRTDTGVRAGGADTLRWRNQNHSTLLWVENNVGNTGGSFNADANGGLITGDAGNFNMTNLVTGVSAVQVAIRNGTQWYVSQNTWGKNNANLSTDILTEKWTPLTLAGPTDTNRMTVMGGSYTLGSALSLTDVNALGYFYDSMNEVGTGWCYLDTIKVEFGSQPSAYQTWAAGYNVYNDAAAFANDYDGDGISNGEEWGLGGNPNDINNVGIQDRRMEVDGSGSFIYMYPRMINTPRPTYNVAATENLVVIPFTILTAGGVDYTETGSGGLWLTNGIGANFEVVTNSIPMINPVEFYKLLITE